MKITRTVDINPINLTDAELKQLTKAQLIEAIKEIRRKRELDARNYYAR